MKRFWNWLTGEEQRKWRENVQDELRAQREQSKTDNKRHREQLEAQLKEMKKAEQEHQEELKKKDAGVALEGKLGRKRIKLLNKKPGDSGNFPEGVKAPSRLFVSFFGETGTGKTSLINSLKYTIEGQLKIHDRVQSASKHFQGAHTQESLEVVMTKHLSVIDNRGINSERAANASLQDELIAQMEGKYERGKMTWESLAPTHANEEDKKSYCSVMVFSAHNVSVARQYRQLGKRLRDWQGRFPLAVITHVDEVSSKDVRLVLETGGIVDIFEVANITAGMGGRDTVSSDHQLEMQTLLENCFRDGDAIFLRRKGV